MNMKNTYILVGLILIAGIIGIYSYSQETWVFPPDIDIPPPNKDFPTQVKVCEGLLEEECFANDNCIGNYGPSYCSPEGACTQDMVFQGCGPSDLNPEEIQQIKIECDKINGEFIKNRFSGYGCLCTRPDYIGKYGCLQDLINQLKTN